MDTKQLIVTRQFFLPDGFQGIVDIFADNLKSVTKAFHQICAHSLFPCSSHTQGQKTNTSFSKFRVRSLHYLVINRHHMQITFLGSHTNTMFNGFSNPQCKKIRIYSKVFASVTYWTKVSPSKSQNFCCYVLS